MRPTPPNDDVYLGGIRVLVVDDCKLVRATVGAMLEHYGAAVTAVGSADEALETLERERPDVLVGDLAMPGRGGYWLSRARRRDARGRPHRIHRSRAPGEYPARRVPVPHREAGHSTQTRWNRGAPRAESPSARVNRGFAGCVLDTEGGSSQMKPKCRSASSAYRQVSKSLDMSDPAIFRHEAVVRHRSPSPGLRKHTHERERCLMVPRRRRYCAAKAALQASRSFAIGTTLRGKPVILIVSGSVVGSTWALLPTRP